jgi:hypothetical protein
MKRNELVEKLMKEGFSEKTLVNFTDKQLNNLSERMLGEEDMMISKKDPQYQQKVDIAKKQNKTIEAYEELKGNQSKIDKNKNGKIDADDFSILNKEKKGKNPYNPGKPPSPDFNGYNKRKEKKKEDVDEMLRFYDDDGNPIKNKKGEQDAVSTKDKNFKKKTKSKKCSDCDKDIKDCKCDHSHMDESKQVKNWIKGLVENKEFHSFTSKNEIMELIQTKLNESDTMVQHGPKVKKGHNGIPEFMSYDAIASAEPKTAPSKPAPSTKPGTRPTPTRREDPRKTPFQPGPGTNPKPKAKMAEEKKK